jgi:putative ABC transport system ATP-binding protein
MIAGVKVEGVSKRFGAGNTLVQALHGISFSIPDGEMVVIAGPSGSGKTTLLSVVGGIERPDSGSVEIAGTELSRLKERDLCCYRRRSLGFVFQNPSLFDEITVWENVELPLVLNHVKSNDRLHRVHRLLERLGLRGRSEAFPSELSAGEQQRAAIARAIAHRPALLLADEPTANLDSANAKEVVSLLIDLHKEEKVCVLLATHDPGVMGLVSLRIFLRDGSIERTEGLPA